MCARRRPKRSHACIFSRIGVIITVRVDCFFFRSSSESHAIASIIFCDHNAVVIDVTNNEFSAVPSYFMVDGQTGYRNY